MLDSIRHTIENVITRAAVVVIGGGIMGASVAYHLARRGMGDVVVLERDRLGSGSTGRNAGGIRLQFSTEINVLLSQRSLPRIEAFAEETGVDPQFHQVGYLFLITETSDVAVFQRSLAMWERMGVPAERLDAGQARALFPQLAVDDVLLATYCAKEGHADPSALLHGYVARARELGVRFEEQREVSAIDVAAGRVRSVRAGDLAISCDAAVIAAGAWSGRVGHLAGVALPIVPLRRQIFFTDAVPSITRPFPLTVEFATGLYFHREGDGVLFGMADPNEQIGFDDSVNWEFLPTVVERAMARVPVLNGASVRTAWAGFYEDTPDKHPIIGPVDGVDGLYAAAGFSGHGIMHAPATGEVLAELITDGHTAFDLHALRHSRFSGGDLVREHNVI